MPQLKPLQVPQPTLMPQQPDPSALPPPILARPGDPCWTRLDSYGYAELQYCWQLKEMFSPAVLEAKCNVHFFQTHGHGNYKSTGSRCVYSDGTCGRDGDRSLWQPLSAFSPICPPLTSTVMSSPPPPAGASPPWWEWDEADQAKAQAGEEAKAAGEASAIVEESPRKPTRPPVPKLPKKHAGGASTPTATTATLVTASGEGDEAAALLRAIATVLAHGQGD